ncbi:helix-turn-helix domain-containing protein [Streptosporangium brasiliense]|uniref:helix-turn-helix domain-containing protein n=1 Tax=Streptosporangium sp. NPDC052375 TaxID=3366195 RepID=UPI003520466C
MLRYAEVTRCAQGGGLATVQRAKRERVRLRAAGLFACGDTDEQVAGELRVTRMSANRWRRAWTRGGGPGRVGLLRRRVRPDDEATGGP